MPDDMRYFHKVTDGHIVIMGRKNYEANGGALKGRTNIVITRNREFTPDDAIVSESIENAIHKAAFFQPEEVFIVVVVKFTGKHWIWFTESISRSSKQRWRETHTILKSTRSYIILFQKQRKKQIG
jgi:hypothetical protein